MKHFLTLLLLLTSLTARAAFIANGATDFEAQRWAYKNIPNNGGTISGSSYLVGTLYMRELKWWGLRSQVLRANLYLGNQTNALACPIIYDWSASGQTNDGIAGVATNYSESVGFKGNGTSQFISPGGSFGLSAFTVFTNLHIAAYTRTAINETSYLSGYITGSSVFGLAVAYGTGQTYVNMGANGSINVADSNGVGFYVTARNATTNAYVYKNGALLVNETTSDAGVLGAGNYVLHVINNAGSLIQYSSRAQSYYSLGVAIFPAQQGPYELVVRTVQKSLNRQVP